MICQSFFDSVPGFYPDVPRYNFEDKFKKFSFRSLLTLGEVIQSLIKVRTECNKVCAMSLFQAPITKSMRLEEFEQAQGQASSQVLCLFSFSLQMPCRL